MPTNADRVKETTTTAGLGPIVLAGAQASFQSFASAVVDQAFVRYCVTDGSANWEVLDGTFTLAGTTLSRDNTLSSSGAGAPVNFPAGAKDVFLMPPATAAAGMTKGSLASGDVIQVAKDDNMICSQELVLNGTSEVWTWGSSELVVPF